VNFIVFIEGHTGFSIFLVTQYMTKYFKVFAALVFFIHIFTFLIFFFVPSAFVSSTHYKKKKKKF